MYRSPRVLVICHQCHQLGLRQGLGSNLSAFSSGAPMVGGLFSPYQVIGSSSYPSSGMGYGGQCCGTSGYSSLGYGGYSGLGYGGMSRYSRNADLLPYSGYPSSLGYGGIGASGLSGLGGIGSYGLGGLSGMGSGLGGYGSYYVVGNELLGAQVSAPCVPVVSCVPVVTQAVAQPVR
jgi:hypothetical protein